MEATAKAGVSGGEVRRLHIIYFLSRFEGRIEHPHLIRVHHLSRNGVYLRDVKRWLGELRGKDLPEAFAWSYKRRYKAGYVWQDLLDDDLITPISDNEYVLKGSQINPSPLETGSLGERKASIDKHPQCLNEVPRNQTYPDSLSSEETPKKESSEIIQESSTDRSILTDKQDCSKLENEKNLDGKKQNNPVEQSCESLIENCTVSSSSLYRNLLIKRGRKQKQKQKHSNKTETPDDSSFSASSSSVSTSSSSSSFSYSSPSNSKSSFHKSRSYTTGASGVFRNLMSCKAADTNDAVLFMLNKKGTNKSNSNELSSEICKVDKLGGSDRNFGNSWNHQKHQQQQQYGASKKSCDGEDTNRSKKKLGEFMTQTHPKPFGGPICSQCGKSFRPERMHKHMKACRGMKALSKSSADSTMSHRTSTSSNTYSTSNYLLFN